MAISAKHLREADEAMNREVEESRREEHVSGILSLSSEARDMRNAGRKLENEDDDVGLAGVVTRLKESIDRQDRNYVLLMKKLDDVLNQLHGVCDELQVIRTQTQDEGHAARQAVLMGVGKVQQEAEEAAIRGISEATRQSETSLKEVMESSKKYIDSLTQESKKRIERLALVTLPDRLFHGLKWIILILVLFILSHVAWQMVM